MKLFLALVALGVSLNAEIPNPQTRHQDTHSYYQAPHHPHYGYGQPKYSCKVKNIVKDVEVCIPAFETACEIEEVQVKKIIFKEICFPLKKTVCTDAISVKENELCTFSINQRTEETEAGGVGVSFSQECSVQLVSVCLARGYAAQHSPCEERAQLFCFNRPEVSPIRPPVQVTYPGSPAEVCVNKNISLPSIRCQEDTITQTCVIVPEVEQAVEMVESCRTQVTTPHCSRQELSLPQQVCQEIIYTLTPAPLPLPPSYPY